MDTETVHKESTRANTKGAGRAGQSHVIARLQSLFPTSSPTLPRPLPRSSTTAPRYSPSFLKVRIITWNMHDSLPKGNLDDLLGAVPPYVPCTRSEQDKPQIPNMTIDDCHPYHLVVVAGQECPTVSGIPLGLGASFRHKERDKHNDGEKGHRKGIGKEGKDNEDPFVSEGSPPSNSSMPTTDSHSTSGTHGPTSGWSWILEEWFCHGLGQRTGRAETSSASELYNTQAKNASTSVCTVPQTSSPSATGSFASGDCGAKCEEGKGKKKKQKERKRKSCCQDRIGPYELLVKERLMGIYVAVFIYRDLKPLVRGISKSAVTTGLIGGRVGNKGGVGISVNLDGTTLLFVNAHLAAHEERINNRLANMSKIKSELQVNDFLSQDDPRVMAEDLMDRFDHTFVFGDLNFRLNVTRLHADWLISRHEYDQAVKFDQLRSLMKDGKAFVGFKEAPIHFPPTFKYDVKRSIKRDKSHRTGGVIRGRGHKRHLNQFPDPNPTEVEEKDAEISIHLEKVDSAVADEFTDRPRGTSIDTDDNRSFISTTITAASTQSRLTINADYDDTGGLVLNSQNAHFDNGDNGKRRMGVAAQKMILAKAALKAKVKRLAMLKPPLFTPGKSSVKRHRGHHVASSPQAEEFLVTGADNSSSALKATSAIELEQPYAPSLSKLCRVSSKKTSKSEKSVSTSERKKRTEIGGQEIEAGRYDSSSKQRVPSWCDRILWKSTVRVDPEHELEKEDLALDRRNGFGPWMLQLWAQALKPLSTRARASSLSSIDPLRAPTDPVRDLSRRPSMPSGSQTLVSTSSEVLDTEWVMPPVDSYSGSTGFRYLHSRKTRAPELLKSKTIEPTSTTPFVDHAFYNRRDRAQSVTPLISAPLAIARQAAANVEPEEAEELPEPTKDSKLNHNAAVTRGWRFFPFFGRGLESGGSLQPLRQPRKGDICYLGYRTLDDEAMRHLEGRSDHRPVIGSYAIYI